MTNLETIERRGVAAPHYNRAALVPHILLLGVGGFHRAHMALYTDELADDRGDRGNTSVGLSRLIAGWQTFSGRRITSTP